jgi:DNA-binding NtrC family response regulator
LLQHRGIRSAEEVGQMNCINGKSILVIDDDAGMLRALEKVLRSEGGTVATASWVGEVMERLTESKGGVDLIITDLRMPVLNGQSILRAVKAALPKVPVIIITAFGGPEARSECMQAGAAAFLEKPLDTPQLLAAIERVFSSRKPSRGSRARRLWGLGKARAAAPEDETELFRGTEPASGVSV